MKTSLPRKLTIFVLALLTLGIATCLLWTPMKVRYYTWKLRSNDPTEKVTAASALFALENVGILAMAAEFDGNIEEALFIKKYWNTFDDTIAHGERPIQYAIRNDFYNATELFLMRHARTHSVHASDYAPPLLIATARGNIKIAELLIRYDTDINEGDDIGQSPLFYAVGNNDIKMVALLLNNKADVDMTINESNADETCFDFAETVEMRKLLRSHSAKSGKESTRKRR